ncbi:Hypothetical predicted protein, partial [Marmota monax]
NSGMNSYEEFDMINSLGFPPTHNDFLSIIHHPEGHSHPVNQVVHDPFQRKPMVIDVLYPGKTTAPKTEILGEISQIVQDLIG